MFPGITPPPAARQMASLGLALAGLLMTAGAGLAATPAPTEAPVVPPTETPEPTVTLTATTEPTPTLTPTPAPFTLDPAEVPDSISVSWWSWEKADPSQAPGDQAAAGPWKLSEEVAINRESLMPVPLGLVPDDTVASVDAMLAFMEGSYGYYFSQNHTPVPCCAEFSVLSGIYVSSYIDTVEPKARHVYVAVPARDGSWQVMGLTYSFGLLLRPVDAGMIPTDAEDEYIEVQPDVRIQNDTIAADRTLKPGDHLLVFFYDASEDTLVSEPMERTQHYCSGLYPSAAVTYVIEGGVCEFQGFSRTFEYQPSTDGKGIMFLSTR
ncbi:MAG: hypothetical protein IT326_02520 [Anaerolineae bacterium]|nr:hypothetical protein [Anaerolineae bacterium]